MGYFTSFCECCPICMVSTILKLTQFRKYQLLNMLVNYTLYYTNKHLRHANISINKMRPLLRYAYFDFSNSPMSESFKNLIITK